MMIEKLMTQEAYFGVCSDIVNVADKAFEEAPDYPRRKIGKCVQAIKEGIEYFTKSTKRSGEEDRAVYLMLQSNIETFSALCEIVRKDYPETSGIHRIDVLERKINGMRGYRIITSS